MLVFIAPSWLFAGLYWKFVVHKHLASVELRQLNENLAKVNMYWSESESDFRPLEEGAIAQDRHRMLRTFLLMTTLLSLLSLVGMFLLILIFISGRPRLELNTFASELCTKSLDAEAIEALIAELKGRN